MHAWWVVGSPLSLNVKPSVHSHGDWSREVPCYALLFRLRSRPLVFTCPSTLPRAAVARHTGWGGAEGKKYIFSKFLPAAFSIDGRISSRDLTISFFFLPSSFRADFSLEFWYLAFGRQEFWGLFHLQFCRFETCGRRSCMRLIAISSFSIGFFLDVKIKIRRWTVRIE